MVSRLKDTLLLVGDSGSDRAVLREIFALNYNLLEATTAVQARLLLEQNLSCIAAVLADLPLDNAEEVRSLAAGCCQGTEKEVPLILFITPENTGEREAWCFALGATDVVQKPYTAYGVQRRVQVLIDLYLHRWHLEKLVAEQGETIRNANQVMLDALSAIIEHRSTESGNHVLRIRRFTKILLEAVALACPEYGLDDTMIESIASASTLHDIGKITIPDAILNKPGRLSREEFEVMKTHTTVGSQLVKNLSGMGDEVYLRYAYNISLYHHERWDGGGYPSGLEGDDIPICAQVVGLADAFDALTTPRVYKPALPYDRAINMILNGECGVFSPKLLECFKNVRAQFVELAHQYADGYSPKSDQITVPLPAPVWHKSKLDSLQLSQVKYQTLLHYVNDTVIEFDLDSRLYHVVYNPNPDFETLILNAPFDEVTHRLLINGVHPDDQESVNAIQQYCTKEFFELDLRKKSFSCRLYSPAQLEYVPYEITMLRVNTQNQEQRIIIAVFHRLEGSLPMRQSPELEAVYTSPALYGLVSSALRCSADKYMTIASEARSLYPLIGYTEEEIQEKAAGRYLELVLPEDREGFAAAMRELSDKGGTAETEYRLMRKNGTAVWVLDKSRAFVEADGREYIYHAIRDNTQVKETHQRLQAAMERNQTIIDQVDGIVFEWDMRTDTLYCSPKWEEHFGYPPVSKSYSTQIGTETHFHPDDLEQIREAVRQFWEGTPAISLEVRIANAAGRYLWSRISATARLDAEGRLERIVGIITDINELKRAEQTLKEQAERDALTKLLNKASTQQAIIQYLAEKPEETLGAMLVLDLDNFKSVNDSYGHLYGDAILSQVGTNLRRLFRAQDVIGRVGGDEFMVMLKDIPDTDMLRDRCELLLETFREMLGRLMPNLDVSVSIGCALAPAHGSGYAELFQHADEALYAAKSMGKNTYKMYDPREKFNVLMESGGHITTRIDSDEQPGMANDSMVRFIFRCLYESRNIEDTVDELLAYIGEQCNVSRVYIFENHEDNSGCDNTFEWCNQGINPEKESLQNVSYITDIAGWPEVFDERGIFYCTDVTQLPERFRAILEPQGIKSMLQCAIMDGGVFRGYVGFDECTSNRMWTQEQISVLQFLAEILAMFLLKKRIQDKAVEQAGNLRSILDNQDAWIYVIDPDTCRIKFLNDKTRDIAPESQEGMVCYQAFMGRDTRCENCPAAHIRQEKNSSSVIENQNLGVKVRALATQITWNGEDSCLVTCHDVTKESV